MNRIVLESNKLSNYLDDNLSVGDNTIEFFKDGDYILEYINSTLVELEITVCDNVCVNLFVFSKDVDIKVNEKYQLGKNSELILKKFYFNRNVLENVVVNLNGESAKYVSKFSSISKGCEDYHLIINHNNHFVSSMISNKCIGIDKSKINIVIDSVLPKGNIDCVMDQTTRIINMGEVEAAIVPNMFIDDDSAYARHGSVISEFSMDDVFYLMSRGVSYEEAILLLIKGFIFSNIDVDMEKRGKIFSCLQELGR